MYFTGHRGAITEVFHPRLDAVQSLALELLVGDAAGAFLDRESERPYVALRPEPRSLRWRVTTSHPGHGWRLTKEVFTDPTRPALIVRAWLEALGGRDVSELRLYVRHDPGLANSGGSDSSSTRRSGDRTFLVASDRGSFSALGASVPWVRRAGQAMLSSGYAAVSDGLTDLLAAPADHQMDWAFSAAPSGNVEQLGWLELGRGEPSYRRFDLVLAFGASEQDVLETAGAVLDADLDALASDYDAGWREYTASLTDRGGAADDQYYLSAMVLRATRDKSTGAVIAAPATPWGPSRADHDSGGYHLVWPRDAFEHGSALLTAGDVGAARGVVDYLFGTLVQTTDCGSREGDAEGCPGGYSRVGRFPQNAWLDGTPYWTSTQLDEQALPILLAWRLYSLGEAPLQRSLARLWPRIRPTAELILQSGPWTPQDRWEENGGYSPSTMAAAIAGLVTAAELARAQGDLDAASRYLVAADYWQENVEAWTFTSSGPHGDGRYYLRINPSERRGGEAKLERYAPVVGPDAPLVLRIPNGGGEHDQREIVDGGFLELVRLGVKSPRDPFILASLPEYDAILGQTLPGKGEAWFRYDFDGYGETNQGGAWDGETGRGRLWPLLTAERGLYEIARGASGAPYLEALAAFATPEGFIPEQVWNLSTNIGGWQVTTPEPAEPGTATGSVAPLSWAMGEYITLFASIRDGKVVDLPESVCRRYDTCELPLPPGQVSLVLDITAPMAPGDRLYVTAGADVDAHPALGVPAQRSGDGRWRAVLEVRANERLELRVHRRDLAGRFSSERLPPGQRRLFRVPVAGRAGLSLTPTF